MITSRIKRISYQSKEIITKFISTTKVVEKNTKVACRYIYRHLKRLRGGMDVLNSKQCREINV